MNSRRYRCYSYFSELELKDTLIDLYRILYTGFGPQNWWPAETKWEVIVGTILTQAVSWKNVEKAVANMKKAECLTFAELEKIDEKKLAGIIKPAGYYNMKAKKIKAFVNFVAEKYNGQLSEMFKVEVEKLRKELLSVYGIGPETADSILLYAGEYPVFVVDNYTRRIFSRLGYVEKDIKYQELKKIIENNLSPDVKIYNEYHALLVELGKNYCTKSDPLCKKCPLV